MVSSGLTGSSDVWPAASSLQTPDVLVIVIPTAVALAAVGIASWYLKKRGAK